MRRYFIYDHQTSIASVTRENQLGEKLRVSLGEMEVGELKIVEVPHSPDITKTIIRLRDS